MKPITGQRIYLGPHVGFLGLYYHKGWVDQGEGVSSIELPLYSWLEKCPALGGLIVPIEQCGAVMRELNFDYAHNMTGTTGAFVTFYREVQKWLTTQANAATSTIKTKETQHV
jgi:hypothetical protein